MILYHGSSVPVREPKLIQSRRRLDFGPGFYLTSDIEQARKWAARKAFIQGKAVGFISVFSVSESDFQNLKTLCFHKPDEEGWLELVAFSRTSRGPNPYPEDYDVISGPVADDATNRCLADYLDGYLTKQETLNKLKAMKLKDQFVFKTQTALNVLHFKEVTT